MHIGVSWRHRGRREREAERDARVDFAPLRSRRRPLSCLEDTLGRRGSHVGRGGPDREAARPRPRDRRGRGTALHTPGMETTRRGRSSHDFVVKKELQPPRPACTHAHRQTWTRPYINVTLSTSRRHRPFDTSLLAVFLEPVQTRPLHLLLPFHANAHADDTSQHRQDYRK